MNEDSINLLKECNSGCKMAIESMERVEKNLADNEMKSIIDEYKDKHCQIKAQTYHLLKKDGEDGKDPNPMAAAMSKITTEVKMSFMGDSHQAAKLMMDGCNMGIQSICEHENDCRNADETAKEVAHNLVKIEKEVMGKMEKFL
ncbi:hypothetical protein [uncultured Eubacterium sp.]|uniref:hypothetical protein n=1 Tax=uncultured Eubacterium sp. TaxID=165185 RepID=UPI0026731F1C|nr:hypothetical protein [uncultured Eubacterium sp.]